MICIYFWRFWKVSLKSYINFSLLLDCRCLWNVIFFKSNLLFIAQNESLDVWFDGICFETAFRLNMSLIGVKKENKNSSKTTFWNRKSNIIIPPKFFNTKRYRKDPQTDSWKLIIFLIQKRSNSHYNQSSSKPQPLFTKKRLQIITFWLFFIEPGTFSNVSIEF